MTRSEARELVMQLLFQMEIQNDHSEELKDRYLYGIPGLAGQIEYIDSVFSIVTSNIKEIDEKINSHSNGWKVGRLPKVDLSILRLAVAEILYISDIPKEVSINEAVNLAGKFSGENGGRFINGVLSNIDDNKEN